MPLTRITDLSDPRLAIYSSMTDAELRDPKQLIGLSRKTGDGDVMAGLFIAESSLVIGRALDAGHVPFALFVEEAWLERSAALIERVQAGFPDVPAFVATKELMRQLTGYQETRGPLAAFYRPAPPRIEELLEGARRVAVLEDVGNHTNIGALFRSAAALGMDAVVVSPRCHDPFYRRASRVSMGTVFQVPWARVDEQDEPGAHWADALMPLLRAHGFATVALALTPEAIDLDDQRLHGHDRLALVLGTEGEGLDPRTIAACDHAAIIPMHHGVDSLNVAAASAVAFWELRVRK